MDPVSIIGILGGIGVMVPYLMALFKRWKVNDYKFYAFNLLGGSCLLANGILGHLLLVYPLINLVWALGTIYQWVREILRRRKKIA